MGSVFALLTAVPGAERDLLERLAGVPGVVQLQHMFGEQIALRLEAGRVEQAEQLARLQGVREARVYHGRGAYIVRRPSAGS